MKHLNDMRIGVRLGLGFGVLLGLLVAVALLALSRLAVLQHHIEEITQENNAEVKLAVSMRVALNQIATSARNMVLLSDEEGRRREREGLQKSRDDYNADEEKLGEFIQRPDKDPKAKDLFARMQQLKAQARPLMDQALALAEANDDAAATRLLMEKVHPAQKAWMLATGELAELEYALSDRAAAEAAASYAKAYLSMGFEPLYFGVTTLEEVAPDVDWRFDPGPLNVLSERIQSSYEYTFMRAGPRGVR